MEINLFEAGNRIKQIREKHGYTMADLGKLVDANSPSTINNWEKGNNLPNRKRLEKIALLGGTSVEWIKYGDFSDYVYRLTQNIEEKILKEYGETTLNNYREALLDELTIEKITYEEDAKILAAAEKINTQNIFQEVKYMYSPDEDYRNIEVKPDLGLTDDNKNIKMIGQRIRKIRKKENITLEEFGKLFSPTADKAVISNWENGKNLPNSERIKKIAEIGGVSELYLMTGVDSSVAESMYFLSEVALDALERLSIEEVNRIIESFAGYLNVISKIDDPDKREISLNAICQLSLLDKMG
ncbi:helix-turn-helix domain-containing protein [Enterococcus faecium]|uniref:helix-turn-helix domain-containing protein n=1 Tax=Enterococcus faecium TaxID=1352 RepID=UPI000F0B9713|nr:helix-turn-helix transcriptional regulator [Enterococcus faecium]HAP4654842.1 helix-turn-helix transcriptional regulator [Enterococcus faecalis]MBX9129929.1 helix-turn-helix transcriptional regulator [Enterococcus faecium]MBX9134363.1 helix-turn-helix transcriptional regulator [Enterococcus faecium]MBY3648679.1 helix-turn-helix transcriptional regulator [Enterococcus faecium]MCF8639894.1 helix-turn-helix domain-containing protein [Enterococcus faecium]